LKPRLAGRYRLLTTPFRRQEATAPLKPDVLAKMLGDGARLSVAKRRRPH